MKKWLPYFNFILSLPVAASSQSIEKKLFDTIKQRDTLQAKTILKKNSINLNYSPSKTYKTTFLSLAITYNQKKIIKLLLKKGAFLTRESLNSILIFGDKEMLKLIAYYGKLTNSMIDQTIQHPRATALSLFLAAGAPLPAESWKTVRERYHVIDLQKPNNILEQEYEDYLIKKYEAQQFKQSGKIIKDYLGIYTERGEIAKHGIQTVCNDGTGHAIVLPEIALKNIARYRIQ